MSSRFDVLLGSTLLIAVLLACANASPVFRLDAAEPDSTSRWMQGRQILTRTAGDSLAVSVAYERSNDTHHIFRVLIRNRTDSTLTVDPAQSYAAVLDRLLPLSADTVARHPERVHGEQVAVVDPESKIVETDLKQSRAEARAANAAAFDLLAMTLDTAGDVAQAAKGQRTPEERTADAIEDAQFAAGAARRSRERQATINAYDRSRLKWSEVALRKTTLLPNTHAGGPLFLPISEDAGILVLRIVIGPHTFHFPYQQNRFDP